MAKVWFVEWISAGLAAMTCITGCAYLLLAPHTVSEAFADSRSTLVYTVNWIQQGGPYLPRAIMLAIAYVVLSLAVAVSATLHVRIRTVTSRRFLWGATILLIISAIIGILVRIPESSALILPAIVLALVASIMAAFVPTSGAQYAIAN